MLEEPNTEPLADGDAGTEIKAQELVSRSSAHFRLQIAKSQLAYFERQARGFAKRARADFDEIQHLRAQNHALWTALEEVTIVRAKDPDQDKALNRVREYCKGVLDKLRAEP